MKCYLAFIICSIVQYVVQARQLSTVDGDSLWIATIDDGYDCDDMTSIIKKKTESNRRFLKSDIIHIEEMKGDDDCFIEFSGTLEMAKDVNNTIGVIDVDPNNEIHMSSTYSWSLDRADQNSMPLNKEPYSPSFTGVGQTVYIIDTGVYKDHNDLIGRTEYGADFINEETQGDNNGHGTHCASISAGATYGIAPDASVIGIKVLSQYGSGSIAGVIKGVQWAVNNAGTKTSVLSLSLGGSFVTSLNKAVSDAAKKHIVVVAAGNDNGDACRASPASAGGNVITVGSSTKNDFRSGFSNWGTCVDIFGPGSDIIAAFIGSNTEIRSQSGTSMATPYIAGIALQILEKNDGNLELSYDDLFSNAITNKLNGNIGVGSPNLLGLIPSYTGPPTMPTLKPTMPPTRPSPKLCLDTNCLNFVPSNFGLHEWTQNNIMYDIAVPNNRLMCELSQEDFNEKIVVVERGECLFFEKVSNCEKQGAKAVIIVNNNNGMIFSPAYYGDGITKTSSCMVSKNDGMLLFNNNGEELIWGRNDGYTSAPTTIPPSTSTPTVRPTRRMRTCSSFTKRECRNRIRRCRWGGHRNKCYKR